MVLSRWEKRVYNYLLQVLRDREDALDLCQETFLKAYRALGRLEEVDRFPQWIFRIARNEAVSLHRRNRFRADDEDAEAASDLIAAAAPRGAPSCSWRFRRRSSGSSPSSGKWWS